MKSTAETASEKFLSGYNCAQSVLWAFAPRLNFDAEAALKIACGLGAGMGRRQEVCGAVTGGILALGLKFGRGSSDDRSVMEKAYAKTQELMRRFEAAHGTCTCRQLLEGCDLTTEAGRSEFKTRDMLRQKCEPCVRAVCDILEDLLME